MSSNDTLERFQKWTKCSRCERSTFETLLIIKESYCLGGSAGWIAWEESFSGFELEEEVSLRLESCGGGGGGGEGQCGGDGQVCLKPWQGWGGEGAGCFAWTCREAHTEYVQVFLGLGYFFTIIYVMLKICSAEKVSKMSTRGPPASLLPLSSSLWSGALPVDPSPIAGTIPPASLIKSHQ